MSKALDYEAEDLISSAALFCHVFDRCILEGKDIGSETRALAPQLLDKMRAVRKQEPSQKLYEALGDGILDLSRAIKLEAVKL